MRIWQVDDKNLNPQISKQLQVRAAILSELDKRFEPHRGQQVVMHALHVQGCSYIFVQCGRKWGKTEIELRLGIENCVLPLNEGETTLYCAYEDDQAKKIVWLEGRAQKFCHPSWIHKVYDSDMRISFKNGRQFMVDGSNNYKKHEGIRPSMLLCDEFKRFKPEFWTVMQPNLSVYNAPVIFAGSPPDTHCQYVDMAEFVKLLQNTTGEGHFTQQPSWMNDKTKGLIKWLENARKHYELRGELNIWDREYGAIYVPGGASRIYPEYRRERVARSDEFLREHIAKHANEWDWFVVADPANDDPFAIIFAAIHRFTRRIAVVDGIYETERSEKTVKKLWERIRAKCKSWYPRLDQWMFYYDDQASWWAAEYNSQVPLEDPDRAAWTPSGKLTRSKDSGISVVNHVIADDLLWVAHTYESFHKEHENYKRDENGNVIKRKDHNCDAFRYLLVAANYDPNVAPKVEIPESYYSDPWLMKMIVTQEDLDSEKLINDWTEDMFSDWVGTF